VPQRVMCDGCGAVLYEGAEVESPFEIIASYDGKCAECGRKLSSTPLRVDVKILELTIDSSSEDLPARARCQVRGGFKKLLTVDTSV